MTVLVAAVAALLSGCGRWSHRRSAYTAPPVVAVIASAVRSPLPIYRHAGSAAAAFEQLSDRTPLGSPRVLLVREARGAWLRVMLPQRPDGVEGWVRAGDVRLSRTNYRIDVTLGTHQLTAYNGSQVMARIAVANGATATPTPPGIYFVTDVVNVAPREPWYGPNALGLSGYSPILTSFEGGDAQIAIHGTDQPQLLGQAITHGCIRVPNATVASLARLLPLGTPVVVHP